MEYTAKNSAKSGNSSKNFSWNKVFENRKKLNILFSDTDLINDEDKKIRKELRETGIKNVFEKNISDTEFIKSFVDDICTDIAELQKIKSIDSDLFKKIKTEYNK